MMHAVASYLRRHIEAVIMGERTKNERGSFFEACHENKAPKERATPRRAATIFSEGHESCDRNGAV